MAPNVVVDGTGDGLHLRIEKHAFHAEPESEKEHDKRMSSVFHKHQFTVLLIFFHVLFMVLLAVFSIYDPQFAAPGTGADVQKYLNTKYAMFQETHVMIFMGFGFIMTFLRRYGYSAIAVNMMMSCFVIEWGLIINGFLSDEFKETRKFHINLDSMLNADFATAIILISVGAMLGKLSPSQYLVMAFIETPVALVTQFVILRVLQVNDIGASMVCHMFGCYFGMACATGIAKKSHRDHEHEGHTYHSDIFAMIGSLILWVYWPSFNAAAAKPADAEHRAVLNTFFSLSGSTLTVFVVSQIVDKRKRFNMAHVANATIAGGVAIGSTANVVLEPIYALVIGSLCGIISVVGYQYISPFLSNKLGIHDTCGVNNIHGLPGILSALFSVIVSWIYKKERFGDSLPAIYPAMVATETNEGRSETGQAFIQLAAIGIVLAASIVSGLITGLFLRLPIFNQVRDEEHYADGDYFVTPDDYEFTSNTITRLNHVKVVEKTPLNGDNGAQWAEKRYPA